MTSGVREEVGSIGAVEGLRGVAVLWVVVFHYYVVRRASDDPFVALVQAARPVEMVVLNGTLGVDLFFLLSGFLLALPWFRHAARGLPPPSALAFYARRVRRIVPAYYVQLFLLFALFVPLIRGPDLWTESARFVGANVVAHLAFLHYTNPITSASLSVNGALWTLALEVQFYLLLPLLAPLFVRFPWRAVLACVAIAAGWRWLAAHDLEALVRWQMARGAAWNLPEPVIRNLLATQLPGYLGHFAIGILAGRAWLAARDRPPGRVREATWAAAAVAALGFLYALLAGHVAPALRDAWAWLASPAVLGIALFAFTGGAPRAGAALFDNRVLGFVGRVSYSLYLYHLPLLLAWSLVFPGAGWQGLPLYVAAALALAWISYRAIELPFMSRRKDTAWPTNAAPGASEARPISPITIASGDGRSTTTASSSSS